MTISVPNVSPNPTTKAGCSLFIFVDASVVGMQRTLSWQVALGRELNTTNAERFVHIKFKCGYTVVKIWWKWLVIAPCKSQPEFICKSNSRAQELQISIFRDPKMCL